MCLQALFLKRNIAEPINCFVNDNVLSDSPTISDKELLSLLRDVIPNGELYTLDQLTGFIKQLNTCWKLPKKSEGIQYAHNPSVFNAILHFVDGSLNVYEGSEIRCKWDDLLKWHTLSSTLGEDLLVCAFLAAYDLKHRISNRQGFTWAANIDTDDPVLNGILKLPLSDIHAHLKGSSINFDVNWLCLMNHIDNRQNTFDEMEKFRLSCFSNNSTDSLYVKTVKAAIIRAYLFDSINHQVDIDDETVFGILSSKGDIDAAGEAIKVQSVIESLKLCGQLSDSEANWDYHNFDYAIVNNVTYTRNPNESCAYSVLSGERFFLYSILKSIYSNQSKGGCIATLFYAYLLIKNEIRHEICQNNTGVGFENFNIYEKRKLVFCDGYDDYERLALHLAVGSFMVPSSKNRYYEARIAPKLYVADNIKAVLKNDLAIEDSRFKKDANNWEYRYIFHFIKQPDEKPNIETANLICRHNKLRESVKASAIAISELKNSLEKDNRGRYVADRVVGIDAANSEIACRPEVFSQAFRFLRNQNFIERPDGTRSKNLGVTYHVGEDFMDIIDGLRALDEAINFLALKKGDRLGHALVLGVSVEEYYRLRNYSISMSRQMLVDNMAWLYHYVDYWCSDKEVLPFLKEVFDREFGLLFPDYKTGIPEIELYYDSILLRGDNPECYRNRDGFSSIDTDFDPWGRFTYVDNQHCHNARRQKQARYLAHLYHFNAEFKKNGEEYTEFVLGKDGQVYEKLLAAIAQVQEKMLDKVEQLGLVIECNPTSNFKIGEIDSYDNHPIRVFNNIGLNEQPKRGVSVSINTDDKGVFSTSIEREYALIAHSLIRYYQRNPNGTTQQNVYEWLDRVRRYSIDQIFDKSVKLSEPITNKSLEELRREIIAENDKRVSSMSFMKRVQYSLKYLRLKGNGEKQ